MQTYGLTIPGADSRLYVTPISAARPAPDPKPSSLPVFSSRTRFGSIKAKAATMNGAVTAEEKELSFYELLGIPESGSIKEIKQAYKQLARKYHPDVSPPGRVEEYTEKFIRVQEAYETLSDSRRRAMYDQDMARGLHLAFSVIYATHHSQNDTFVLFFVELTVAENQKREHRNPKNQNTGTQPRHHSPPPCFEPRPDLLLCHRVYSAAACRLWTTRRNPSSPHQSKKTQVS